jgi:hypothetical protein
MSAPNPDSDREQERFLARAHAMAVQAWQQTGYAVIDCIGAGGTVHDVLAIVEDCLSEVDEAVFERAERARAQIDGSGVRA